MTNCWGELLIVDIFDTLATELYWINLRGETFWSVPGKFTINVHVHSRTDAYSFFCLVIVKVYLLE